MDLSKEELAVLLKKVTDDTMFLHSYDGRITYSECYWELPEEDENNGIYNSAFTKRELNYLKTIVTVTDI